ncbi:MAG: hypothetical protein ACYC2K_03615 [Gemmatimonadales bacterium]
MSGAAGTDLPTPAARFLAVVAVGPLLGMAVDLVSLSWLWSSDDSGAAVVPRFAARTVLGIIAASSLLLAPTLRTAPRRVLVKWYGVGLFWASIVALAPDGVLRNVGTLSAKVAIGVLALGAAVAFTRWLRPGLSDLWRESDRL